MTYDVSLFAFECGTSMPQNKKAAAAPTSVGFAGGSAGMAVSRYSPVALCHRLSTALLWAAYLLVDHLTQHATRGVNACFVCYK